MKNKILLIISCIFLTLPLYIFLLCYLNLFIGIIGSIILSICIYRIIKNEKIIFNFEFSKKNIFLLLISIILICIWCYFSGIGSFSYQNIDYNVRNAVLRDLINYKWPVIFEFNENVSNIINHNSAGFVYYFSYFLPSALIGKIFGINFANIFLNLYSIVALILIIFLIRNKFNKNMLFVTIFFMFFSGLDILFNLNNFFTFEHIEWWSKILQYSSNTTQLYWVFNQSIMMWLICILLFYLKKPSSILFISSLSFLYSPFATIGMIPVAIGFIIKNKDKRLNFISYIKNNIGVFEIINTLLILIIYGSFYLAAESSISVNGFIFNQSNYLYIVLMYLIFIIVEFVCYLIFIFKDYKKDILFIIVILELFLIPLYKMTPSNDFCMRVSLGPLFIFMIYVLDYLFKSKNVFKKSMIYILLFIGSFTCVHEIGRSVYNTFKYESEYYLKDKKIYSIGNPKTKYGINLCNEQFYSKNYNEKFFFKYLVKK